MLANETIFLYIYYSSKNHSMSIKGSVTTSDYLNFDSTLNKAMKMIKNVRNYKFGFLVVFGINTGLRISDILKIQVSDFQNDSLVLFESKTNKKRIIKLNDNVKRGFNLLLERDPNLNGYVFTSNQKTVFSVQYINRKIKDVFGTKTNSVSSHSLRKTFGRQVWVNNNETDRALLYLSELFNHTSPAITRRYLGIRQEELDDIYMSL